MSELLRTFGARVGILPHYVNHDGSRRIETSDETYRAILQSMGYSLEDESLRRALQSIDSRSNSEPASHNAVRCLSVEELGGKQQARGIWTNLYTIRSARNWGVGDFGDLRRLVKWAADMGLDFIATNPLHALRNRGHDVSPYRPISRLYRNEIYLEIDALCEVSKCPEASRLISSERFQSQLHLVQRSPVVDYASVAGLKREVLKLLHHQHRNRNEKTGSAELFDYRDYVAKEGVGLRQFATFRAIDDQLRTKLGQCLPWQQWPEGLHDSRSEQVQVFQREHELEIDFHCFVQFELDRQLRGLAQFSSEVGLRMGLMGDLAIGTAPDGSDPWAYPELFVKGVSIGAPPDDLGPDGQDWGLPPINPHKLAEHNFDFFRRLLRNNLAHMGALRIDHVMGLLRQFWIPKGFDGSKGAYVQFHAEELFSILAEESRRSGAVIVGEDLGTVPDGFRDMLARFGVLSTRVVHFEREWNGDYKPASQYPTSAFVLLATHDMVPLAGFAEGRDLLLRRQVGLIRDDASLQEALHRRREDWARLQSRLQHEGQPIDAGQDEIKSVGRALIQFLYQSPCNMVGISLDDLAAQQEPVNVPGVGQDRHASWSRRMTMTLEEIMASPAIAEMVRPANA